MTGSKRVSAWLGLMLGAAGVCCAQVYPSKPVRVIFPFAAGGAGDIIGRAYGQKFTENSAKAGCSITAAARAPSIGTDIAAKAAPDGYTPVSGQSHALRELRGAWKSCPTTPCAISRRSPPR